MNKLDKLMSSFVETGLAAGVSLLLRKDGREVYFGAYGMADKASGAPFQRSGLMRVYSMTKPVTAVAIMTLIEDGLLELHTPVSRFIPEFADVTVCEERGGSVEIVPAKREMTVFHLLTMTSGLSYGDNDVDAAAALSNRHIQEAFAKLRANPETAKNIDTLGLAKTLAACPLGFHPGDRWRYGMSTDVLGALVTAVTGKSPGEYFKERIFDPLGMADTRFYRADLPGEVSSRCAKTYIPSAKGLVEKHHSLVFEMAPFPKFESGGAGLLSTVDDFAVFGEMLRNGGEYNGVRVLKPETAALIASDHLTPEQKPYYDGLNEVGYSYGLSVRVMLDPAIAKFNEDVGAFGWNGAAGTSLRIDPKRGTVLVFGCQRMPPEHEKFLPAVSQACAELLGY